MITKEESPSVFEGIAAMYLTVPMSARSIPVFGSCRLQNRRLYLVFPTTKICFDLRETPREDDDLRQGQEQESRGELSRSLCVQQKFRMAGPRGEMQVSLAYDSRLKAFIGQGTAEDERVKYLTFLLFRPGHVLTQLKEL